MISALLLAAAVVSDPIDRLEPSASPFLVTGRGVIHDSTHPKHPGDVRAIEAELRMTIVPASGEGLIEFETGEGDTKDVDRYFVRRGRVFQVDDKGEEIAAGPLANVTAAAVAAFHPALVAGALRAQRANVRSDRGGVFLFAANDALWSVATEASTGRIVSLKRKDYSEVYGDGEEELVFGRAPGGVTVRRGGRETARFTWGAAAPGDAPKLPIGDTRRDRGHTISAGDIVFTELAPHLFAIDLAPLNTRVVVAEFADHLAVFEGAYNASVGDRLVRAIKERLRKPVRYFAFSHLHGQYIGSTRSFVVEGATILVPPTTAPMVEQIATASHTLQPDAQSRTPKRAKIETVASARSLADAMNAVEIHNVVSEHTDEYFVFWFPGPKILLTGDLLFYRPGKPLAGRSKRLCRTVTELSLHPERFVATWPLDGFDTKNIVTGDEMRAACEGGF